MNHLTWKPSLFLILAGLIALMGCQKENVLSIPQEEVAGGH